jgi:hypothetical protein
VPTLESDSEAEAGKEASDVAGDLQLIAKIKTKQTKTPTKMFHFFIASSPSLIIS